MRSFVASDGFCIDILNPFNAKSVQPPENLFATLPQELSELEALAKRLACAFNAISEFVKWPSNLLQP